MTTLPNAIESPLPLPPIERAILTAADLHARLADHAKAMGHGGAYGGIDHGTSFSFGRGAVGHRWTITYFRGPYRDEAADERDYVQAHGATAEEAWAAFQAATEVLA